MQSEDLSIIPEWAQFNQGHLKSCFTMLLPFLSSNPKILKAFIKTFPAKMKPTKCPSFSWFQNAKKEGVRKSKK